MGTSDRRHRSLLICCLLQLLLEICPKLRGSGSATSFVDQQRVEIHMDRRIRESVPNAEERLLEAPILIFPNFELLFIIDTDASETALGAVLSQMIDGKEYPIAFESRVLTKTEINYDTTKRDALGVVQAVQWFKPYIHGSKCIIRTDHASLQWLFRQNSIGMTFRMVQKLQEYDYQIVHRPSDNHCNADGLSRRPNDIPQ